MQEYLRVGVISTTHGVRGEVKVYPTTDDPERFRELKKVILDTGKEPKDRQCQIFQKSGDFKIQRIQQHQ